MSKKFFSLIHADLIQAAPGKKIIPSNELASLLNAEEVLGAVKNDARQYKLQVARECEELKENAFKMGYEEGLEQWAERLTEFEKNLEALRKEMHQAIIPVALKAAKKIVGRELTLSEDAIVDIVASNLKSVAQHKKIAIYVNKKDLEIVEKNKPRLRELFEHLESLTIRARDDVEIGGCIIETEIGIINAQAENRWRTLEKAFEKLMKDSP